MYWPLKKSFKREKVLYATARASGEWKSCSLGKVSSASVTSSALERYEYQGKIRIERTSICSEDCELADMSICFQLPSKQKAIEQCRVSFLSISCCLLASAAVAAAAAAAGRLCVVEVCSNDRHVPVSVSLCQWILAFDTERWMNRCDELEKFYSGMEVWEIGD